VDAAVAEYRKDAKLQFYYTQGLLAPGFLSAGLSFLPLTRTETPKEEAEKTRKEILSGAEKYFKDFHGTTEKRILGEMLTMFAADIPADRHPKLITEILKKYKGKTNKEKFMAYAEDVAKKSALFDITKYKALAAADAKKISADLGVAYVIAMREAYIALQPSIQKYNKTTNDAGSVYIEGLMKMRPNDLFYPDANSTLRITYGTIRDYDPKDGVHFKHITTTKGILEKFKPKDEEFDVPQRLIDLIKNKDFGPYFQGADCPVAFLSDNDITGGNSGSGVVNARGELIGLAFDGNWEAMTGDLVFDKELKRTISVDMRYVLFIIDKYAGAKHLVDEMTLVR
jgi:hypothetical protein